MAAVPVFSSPEEHLVRSLDRAIDAIHELARLRCSVLRVEAGPGRPRITIDPPSSQHLLRQSATTRTERGPDGISHVIATTTEWGCRIQWTPGPPAGGRP